MNYNQASNNSPTFAPSTAFFNITNGMTFAGPQDRSESIPAETDVSLPPMSPRADALLPSDLLGDEESTDLPEPITDPQFPVVGPAPTQLENPGSPSPVSSESRSAQFFASPHESLRDLDMPHTTTEGISENESSHVQSASRRLSGLFGFNRQRGKTLADGPLLGSLKQGQSRSFPRNFDGMDPIGERRRRLSYNSNWANPMSLFPRSGTTNVTADSSSDRIPSRKSAFANIFSSSKFGSNGSDDILRRGSSGLSTGYNQFSPRHDPIDPSSILGTVRRGSLSPRPSSTFSFDKHLPHPSTEPFGWPSGDLVGQRSSLAFDWASPTTWSRAPSRRPSTQYGSSTHLPLGLGSMEPDYLQGPYEKQHRPLQAPIGTRPSSSPRPVTPKLNPAAPTFKTLFSKRSDKGKDKDSGNSLKSQDFEFNADESSPPASRRSKDSRALSYATESADSLELAPSSSPSDNVNAKESFIQKITRKSSSSKFSLSWKDRAGIFSKKNDSLQGDIDEDGNDGEVQLGKSMDSISSSTPSAEKSLPRSSRNFFSRKPKKDQNTGDFNEKASETGDEELLEQD